jgi:UDP-N-acetylmuramate--alanine ligase
VKLPLPSQIPPCEELGNVHFIGIGGAGLSAIARIMLARGVVVTGSDGSASPTLAALADLGATVWAGHHGDQVDLADTVIVSTAIPESNPEIIRAQERGIPLWPRSAGMVSIMAGKRVLAVAGTHGKTTTTSLLASGMLAAGIQPTFTIGGDLAAVGTNAAVGAGEWFIAEADESDGAFLAYEPFGAVVTNVDADHLDQWGTEDAYRAAFSEFVKHVHPDGFVVLAINDAGSAALAETAHNLGREVVTTGLDIDADLVGSNLEIDDGQSRCLVSYQGRHLGELRLQIPGRHYVIDALAALGAGLKSGASFDGLVTGMSLYQGTKRRMELKGERHQIRVFDSYAHHPQEILADLAAARTLVDSGQLVVAFQPHLVSRTRIFGSAMGQALSAADQVVLLDIYLSREVADPAVSSDLIADAMTIPPAHIHRVAGIEEAAEKLRSVAKPGDVVLTLGAGSVTHVGPLFLGEEP